MPERKQATYINVPYAGLFGDTHQIRVIQQVIADPHGSYKPKELEALIEASSPSVRKALKNLTRIGLLIKDIRDKQHPIYRVHVDSPIYHALNFLAFAVPDHINHTYYMQDVIADYYDSELREKYEPFWQIISSCSDLELCTDMGYGESDTQYVATVQDSTQESTYERPFEISKFDRFTPQVGGASA